MFLNLKNFFQDFLAGLKIFSANITCLVNTILLLIAYLIGIGLSFIIAKFINKHFLDLNIDKNKNTYWSDLNLTKKDLKNYLKQF